MRLPRNIVTLWTKAGPTAPDEIKGTNKYFHPERLEWRVQLGRNDRLDVYVVAHGSATRVVGQGLQGWSVMGQFPDPLPDWIDPPWDDIYTVADMLLAITNETDEEGRVIES